MCVWESVPGQIYVWTNRGQCVFTQRRLSNMSLWSSKAKEQGWQTINLKSTSNTVRSKAHLNDSFSVSQAWIQQHIGPKLLHSPPVLQSHNLVDILLNFCVCVLTHYCPTHQPVVWLEALTVCGCVQQTHSQAQKYFISPVWCTVTDRL